MSYLFKSALIWVLVLSPRLFAATTGAYGADWFSSDTWYGDWPNGFAVVGDNVSVPAHSTIDPKRAPDLSCRLPKNAVIHIWNVDRSLQWFTYAKIVPLLMTSSFQTTLYDQRGRSISVQLTKGDPIEYLVYESDNFALFRFRGGVFEADLGLLEHVNDPESTQGVRRDQWVYVDCVNQVSGWILFQDLLTNEGEYIDGLASWVLGLKGYGEVHDLSN